MTKLRAAVIGCGNISSMHLDAIKALDNVELVGVCDILRERAEDKAKIYNTKAFTDYHELFNIAKPDAVHLCLPHYLHTIVARDAFSAGIHVLSEKPIGIQYSDALQTVEMAEQCALQYGVIFQNRYNAPSVLVKKRIEDGRLGRVKSARAVLSWERTEEYYSCTDWKGTWDMEGGGVMINQAIHILDLANWFINSEPVKVEASIHNRLHPHISVEDTAEGLVQYSNGARLLFYATNNYYSSEDVEIRLYCENGKAILSYDDLTIRYFDGTVESVNNQDNSFVYSGGKACWGQQHFVQISHFYNAVSGIEILQGSAREALRIQKIICGIYQEPYKTYFGE